MSLVEVEGLTKHYPVTKGILKREVARVRAVDGIDFDVERGETVGLVGESGCGKSTAATSLLRIEEPTGGVVRFDGEDITGYDKAELKRFRRRAQMIFQNPKSSFDPRMSIGDSVGEPLKIHGMSDGNRRRAIVEDLLERVGLTAEDADRYPHEFSGGQKQRIALARALSVNPDFIVADEPVSALDVSIKSEILSLMEDLQEQFDLAVLLISHDMGVVRQVCDRVNVMYLGEIVESGPTEEVFENPQHPYTASLMSAVPVPDPRRRGMGAELTGDVPSPSNPPSGCRFHTRCPAVIQPEGYDFDQSAWRNVVDLKTRLKTEGIEIEALVEGHAAETDDESEDPADYAMDELTDMVREEFDLPARLEDPEADDVLTQALESIATEDQSDARDLLDSEFETVCEREAPAHEQVGRQRSVSCHLDAETVREVTLSDD
jgi:peptide/nickel transport system ATP-binding protein